MDELRLKELTEIAGRLFEEDKKSFPYADCRKAAALAGIRIRDLVPDLDAYFSDLAGYCSWKGRILTWSSEKIATAREHISKSFFEKHPQYQGLKEATLQKETPGLAADLALHEEMRTTLIELLDGLGGITETPVPD